MKSTISLKICSGMMVFFFAINTLIPPRNAFSESDSARPPQEEKLFGGLSPQVCDVEEIWYSPQQNGNPIGSAPLVILLQEAHVNYGAQKNIVATLEHFQQKFKSMNLPENLTIALEGNPALKEIDPIIFRAFPLPDVTRQVSDTFMRNGRIDGAEFYAINSNKSARLFGIDDYPLYQKNILSYKNFRTNQGEVIADLEKVRSQVEKLKEKVYTKPLKDLEESRKRFGRDTGSLQLHLKVLQQAAKLKNISFENYPLVQDMQNLFDQESKLTPEKLEEKMHSIKSYDFFDEMSKLELFLYDRLAASRDEKTLVMMDQDLSLLEKLAHLSLTQNDFNELEKDWPAITRPEDWKQLDDLFHRRNIAFQSWKLISEVLGPLESARDFYLTAEDRNEALTKNVEKLMDVTDQKIIFVVAGGFHTEGMTKKLREQGISFIALTPMANPDEDETLYWNRLSGVGSHSQNLMAQLSTAKPESEENDPEFQQDAINALLAAAIMKEGVLSADGKSLGISKADFQGLLQNYGRGLLNAKADPNKIAAMREAFSLIPGLPGTQINLPFDLPTSKGTYRFTLLPGNQLNAEFIFPRVPNMPLTPPAPPPLPPRAPLARQQAPQVQAGLQPASIPPELANDPFVKRFNSNPNRKFSIVKLLGVGGMGSVYKGVQEGTGKEVAIKTIQSMNNIEELIRFRREAEAMMAINNPRIARVYDYVDEKGSPYYVMEIIEGQDWNKIISGWTEPPNRERIPIALKMMLEALVGLKAIHDRKMAHRDLKPANIYQVPGRGAVIADFGLAVYHGEKDRLTKTGEVMGTPEYMSPDQILGEKDTPITDSSDIFSMGVILYELLTKTNPFAGGSALKTLNNILKLEPAPPKSINPDISDSLNAVVMRALAKTPGGAVDQRYMNIDAFIEDLLRAQQEYVSQDTAELSAAEFDAMVPGGTHEFSQSLQQPVEALGYMAWRKQHLKWYNRLGRELKKHPIIYSTAIVVALGSMGGMKWYADRTANQQQEEKSRKIATAKDEMTQANQDIQSGNLDSALTHLNEVKKLIAGLDPLEESVKKLIDEIDVKTKFINSIKSITEAETRIRNNQSVNPTVLPSAADQLATIVPSNYLSDEMKTTAQLNIAKARLLQATPDLAQAAQTLKSVLDARASRPQMNMQNVNDAIMNLFSKAESSPYLSQDAITKLLELGRSYNSLMAPQIPGMDKGKFRMTLAYLAGLPGTAQNRTDAAAFFAQAIQDFDQTYQSGANPAAKEAALLQRGIAESKAGNYSVSNQTFEEFRSSYPNSERISDVVFAIANNLNHLGAESGKRAYDASHANQPFAQDFESMKSSFESARRELNTVLEPLMSRPDGDLQKLRVQTAILDSYLAQMATIAMMYRNVLQFNSRGPNDPLLGQLYPRRNELEKEIKDTVENLNSPSSRLHQFSDEFVQRIKRLSETAEISRDDAERLKIAVLFYLKIGMLKGLQNADIANREKIARAAADLKIYFDRLTTYTTQYPSQGQALAAPYLNFLRIYRGEQAFPVETTFTSDGMAALARMYLGRDSSILNRTQSSAQVLENAERAQAELSDPGLQLFAEIMKADGRSLGAAVNGKEIFKSVQLEKTPRSVFMELNRENLDVLEQLINESTDFRKGNKSQSVLILVPDKELLTEIRKKYGNPMQFFKDYGIGLIATKKQLAQMTKIEVENVMKKSMAYLRPQGRAELQLSETIFLNDQFGESWGPEAKRIRYKSNDFNSKEDYRTAYISAALYLLSNGQKQDSMFGHDEKDPTILELLPGILADLISAWKSLKETLVSA